MAADGYAPGEVEGPPDATVGSALVELNRISWELGNLATQLHHVEEKLKHYQLWYDDGLGAFESAMFAKYEAGNGKWPSEETRERLYRHQLATNPQHATNKQIYDDLHLDRKGLMKLIGIREKQADAQRSVLSALKVEMEATAHT